jgi:DNA helicase-2/ATP-dependent DNA helicase PcrA
VVVIHLLPLNCDVRLNLTKRSDIDGKLIEEAGVKMEYESKIPKLDGEAAAAVTNRGSHIQIIASAGSGKTETVSQRVAKLIEEGIEPAEIVAFTFTTRAADELKERIRARVIKFAGQEKADRLGNMYVGTIHGYCFQMLQTYVSKFESYSVLDEKQQVGFLVRYYKRLELEQFKFHKGKFVGIKRFKSNIEVLENELLNLDIMTEEFQESAKNYYELLEDHRFLTYGLQIAEAVKALQDPEISKEITRNLKHLIVDEYQDVNPAQERLIQLLTKPHGGADLVVVGDDDQAIYQWRGSSVENIVTFAERYDNVKSFRLLTNRRSRPAIVSLANKFAKQIPGRLDKEMLPDKTENGPAVDISLAESESAEAEDIASTVSRLKILGYNYKDMAVLVRGRAAYPRILEAFKRSGIPVQPGDREGLFEKDDADFLGRCFVWFADWEWKLSQYDPNTELQDITDLAIRAKGLYSLDSHQVEALKKYLKTTKQKVGNDSRSISLVKIGYGITDLLEVKTWDQSDPLVASRLGTIARFMQFVADYEAMAKSAKMSREEQGRQIGAANQGEWYFKNLAILLTQYALGEYRDFEGEDDLSGDSVDLLTVHSAKGLEWPIVFIPSLTKNRFPSSKAGNTPKEGPWLVPTDEFDFARYQGTEPDEMRLFYVAVTRAREWVSLSSHEKVTKQAVKPSPYFKFAEQAHEEELEFPAPWSEQLGEANSELHITYSELADYLNCGMSFWLRSKLGFPPAIVEEIGFGNAVHHLMRAIAETTAKKGKGLRPAEVDKILATEFFLPFAGKAVSDKFRESARGLVFDYMLNRAEELDRVWETERPFELALPGVVISGRADVVLDKHEGKIDSLAIMDYKTRIDTEGFELQLQVYAEAGIREGLKVSGAFVHGLDGDTREIIPIDSASRAKAVDLVILTAEQIKNRQFEAKPEKLKCGMCDVRTLCKSAAKS